MAANVAWILIFVDAATIPFHFIWLSLTIVYGYRVWRLGTTLLALAAVCLIAGSALTYAVLSTDSHLDELTEVPMMAVIFLAVVWHARRRQAAVEELRLTALRERDFIRDASHQLRTPITIARTHAELLGLRAESPQDAEDADVIVDELSRLGRISDRLLILAMADRHEFLASAPIDLGRIVEETTARWTTTAPRDWDVRVQAAGTLLGDAERLEAMLDALIENAIKATDGADRITVGLSATGRTAVIEVSDTGVGIPEENLDRIFDRFWRANRSNGARGGTGLGLAMVKAIAEAHGGTVRATRRPGGGTTMRVTLNEFSPGRVSTAALSGS